jgi:predicted metal-dependent enzyme (double-stranded beta helix superfamily)
MDLKEFVTDFKDLVHQNQVSAELIEGGRALLGELLSDRLWYRQFLERLVRDKEFLSGQVNSIWPNEVALWRDADGEFSVLAYIWEPHAVDAVHDHGSWGVIGSLVRGFRERKYRRLDSGRIEGHAELQEVSCRVIGPGETSYVLPLDEGIHRTENDGDSHSISINVYGKPVRRGYIQFFDIENRTVKRVFPPRTNKRVLAVRFLGTVGESWAENILTAALRDPLPDFIKAECEESLERLRRDG